MFIGLPIALSGFFIVLSMVLASFLIVLSMGLACFLSPVYDVVLIVSLFDFWSLACFSLFCLWCFLGVSIVLSMVLALCI